MAPRKMLIDAAHPEEIRIALLSGNRLEDYDVEVESRRQLKGNIYLAKVIRVEPSLQAAFVDFGGNRHGFLAFNEIHPDYYQIPIADREALLAEHETAGREDDDSAESEEGASAGVETLGGDESEEVEARRPRVNYRQYRIQEVIKRRQILLVQVVKEERGTKGAALTTYISLAGRYCVLMPNTGRGGGISRKIPNGADRKKLRSILNTLDIPAGMAVIVRTAGAKRTKAEIKRDYEYLVRLWDTIREVTLKSTAPALIHEEANLIKRSIRDLYSNDIEEIVVEGEDAYRTAKDFMKLLIPSHARRVQRYRDHGVPLFQRYQVESQLEAIHAPTVQLKSGGYIVINPTEALVAIDVNSGRATRERNIEETALRTNLEAADEIARQVRLRDLAGLIVVDFIDMEVSRNNAQVERRLREALRHDRARIQLGRISPFGLLEFSRQRLRPSLLETITEPCPYCGGTGVRRSTESSALIVLRAIEQEAGQRRAGEFVVHCPTAVVLYILNYKRAALADIEARNDAIIRFASDDSLIPPDHRIEPVKGRPAKRTAKAAPAGAAEAEEAPAEEIEAAEAAADEEEPRRRRRRRPRRRKRTGEDREAPTEAQEPAEQGEAGEPPLAEAAGEAIEKEGAPKRRRRGRRGGRRRARGMAEREPEAIEASAPAGETEPAESAEIPAEPFAPTPALEAPAAVDVAAESLDRDTRGRDAEEAEEAEEKAPARKKARRRAPGGRAKTSDREAAAKPAAAESTGKPRRRRKTARPAEDERAEAGEARATAPEAPGEEPSAEPETPAYAAAEPAVASGENAEPTERAVSEPSPGTVINIAAGERQARPDSRRKGWWQRATK